MIATILPSSTTFHAVDYNERKVSEGVAELLEMKNFGSIGKIDPYTPDELKQYLIDYTQRNEYIKKPQFHLAISCRADEYTQEQNPICIYYNRLGSVQAIYYINDQRLKVIKDYDGLKHF